MDYYYPFTDLDIPDGLPAKKNALDGFSDFDTSFFETDDAKIQPTDQELQIAEVVHANEPKVSPRKSKKTEKLEQVTNTQIQGNESVPYSRSYDETTAMLRQAIMQTDVLVSEIKEDIDKIRSSSTMKSKYTYITNLASTEAGLIGTKVQAISRINDSISKAHELELKRAKDLKDMQRDKQSDDARMMDMYNAFVNSPVGMYQNGLNMPTIPDMLLGTNGVNPTVQGISMGAQGQAMQQQEALTPEQIRMRMESNPNIEEVVMYEPSTGRRWFDVINNATMTSVPNYPRSDEFLLADCTIDVRSGTARNRNIDKVWRLINVEGGAVSEY